MTRGSRAELERLVQDLHRIHPDWPSSRIETELELLAPLAYGNWKEDAPVLRTRHRQVQRWRTGEKGTARKGTMRLPFQYLWPVGEKQRHQLDSEFRARATNLRASHRIFLHNCSTETLREVRVQLDGKDVAYEPSLEAGKLTEIHWVRNQDIRSAALVAAPHQLISHELRAEFAFAKGMRQARLEGALTMDSSDGWLSFVSERGPSKEIE